MACINEYLTSRARDLMIGLEESIVRAIRTAPGAKRFPDRSPSFLSPMTPSSGSILTGEVYDDDSVTPADNNADSVALDYNLAPFGDLELIGLEVFQDASQRDIPGFIHKMISFGLQTVE